MKKLVVFSLFILSAFISNAQGFSFGPKVGANITGISGLQFENGYQFGYHIGGFAEIMISENLGIQPEVLWSQTNLTTANALPEIYQTSLSELSKVKLNYISIPLLLNIRPSNFISFQVGPQFGILQDKKNSLSNNVQSAFKSGDFSMLAGVQMRILSFRIYGRYGIGLTSVNDLIEQDQWKSRTWQIGLAMGL